jgi:hypothetical protein
MPEAECVLQCVKRIATVIEGDFTHDVFGCGKVELLIYERVMNLPRLLKLLEEW